jgi:hypothetical protein
VTLSPGTPVLLNQNFTNTPPNVKWIGRGSVCSPNVNYVLQMQTQNGVTTGTLTFIDFTNGKTTTGVVTSLVSSVPNAATFFGTATVNGVPGYTFTVDLTRDLGSVVIHIPDLQYTSGGNICSGNVDPSGDTVVVDDISGKIGVFRNGFWILDNNGDFQWSDVGAGKDLVAGFGMAGDTPVVGNWDHTKSGDKIGVFRNGSWLIDYNGNYQWDGTDKYASLGQTGDIPLVGDWNTNEDMKIGIFRNGFWMLDKNGNYQWDGPGAGGDVVAGFGQSGDIPVIGDWYGTSQDKIGIFRDGFWILDKNGNYQWDGSGVGGDVVAGFGMVGDVPVVRDWNGDDLPEIAVFRPTSGQWIIDHNGNYQWDGTGTGQDVTVTLGQTGDVAISGDWGASGTDKIGIFRNGFWIIDHNGNYVWDGSSDDKVAGFGMAGDIPVTGKWNIGSASVSAIQTTPDQIKQPSLNTFKNVIVATATATPTTIAPVQIRVNDSGNSLNSTQNTTVLTQNITNFQGNGTNNGTVSTGLNMNITTPTLSPVNVSLNSTNVLQNNTGTG